MVKIVLRPVQASMKVNMNFKYRKQKYYKKRKNKQGHETCCVSSPSAAPAAIAVAMAVPFITLYLQTGKFGHKMSYFN